ncbi:MAG: hypothetical protein ACYSX0_20975 [Planctomycetota bacterium]
MALLMALLPALALAEGEEKEKPPPPFEEALEEFDRAAKQKDSMVLATAARALARSAAAVPDKKLKVEALKRLHLCLRHPAPAARMAGLDGYGRLALRGSSRDLLGFVDRKRNKSQRPEIVTAALEAWGKIHDPKSHEMLLTYVRVPSHKAGARNLAVAAARALAHYDPAKGNKRYQFFRDLVQALERVYGAATGGSVSAAATQWWASVGPELIRSINTVAFGKQRISTYEECRAWWKDNHRRIKSGR